jgi:hypothetical protein
MSVRSTSTLDNDAKRCCYQCPSWLPTRGDSQILKNPEGACGISRGEPSKGLSRELNFPRSETRRRPPPSIAPAYRLWIWGVLRLLDPTTEAFAIAILATIPFMVPSRAADAQNTTVPRAIVNGPLVVSGEATSSASPREQVGPGAVNPSSERAQRIKKDLPTPVAPGANPYRLRLHPQAKSIQIEARNRRGVSDQTYRSEAQSGNCWRRRTARQS